MIERRKSQIFIYQLSFVFQEVVVSNSWSIANEPVDLFYDTWFPTDHLSANLRHTISVIFSHRQKRGNATDGSGRRRRRRRHDGQVDSLGATNDVAQSMDVDQVSDVSDEDDDDEDYKVETPSSITMEEGAASSGGGNASASAGGSSSPGSSNSTSTGAGAGAAPHLALSYYQRLALTGPPGSQAQQQVAAEAKQALVAANSRLSALTRSMSQPAERSSPSDASRQAQLPPPAGSGLQQSLSEDAATAGTSSSSVEADPDPATCTIVNESIISLMLRLHSKYSAKPDSYAPPSSRSGLSVTEEYMESRVGDACFFIEKVLDRIVSLDEACAQSVDTCRKQLWPDYHEEAAKRDEEKERKEKEEKKRKARERQKAMMEQMAAQRRRFMQANPSTACEEPSKSGAESASAGSSSAAATVNMDTSESERGEKEVSGAGDDAKAEANEEAAPEAKEYTCCHCLLQAPATEERPIGLVTLTQSTSVLAHRHRETAHLVLPAADESSSSSSTAPSPSQPPRSGPSPPGATLPSPTVESMQEDSLGTEYQYRFLELLQEFNPKSVFLSVHHSWKGGIHIQSCGHHMHFDCRQSYCETLKQQMRVTRDQALDTDQGEFICPVCRQMANGLLPVPPPPPLVPANSLVSAASLPAENRRRIASKIHQLLGEETVHLASFLTHFHQHTLC